MSNAVTAEPTLQRKHVRALIVGLAGAGFMLILGSLAWACLPYHGTVSVYPVNPGGQAVNQFAHGERSVTIHGGARQFEGAGGMRWCTGGDDDSSAPYQAGAIRPSAHSPDLMVVVEDRLSACHEEGAELPVGPYNVAINHAVYGDDGMNGFDKNAVNEDAGHRLGSCYFQNGEDNPDDYDYVHPEPIMVGEDGGSLLIEDINMGPSSEARPFDNIAGLCLRSDTTHQAPMVPIEILGDRPGNPGGNGNGRGR